ncbi:hypothetical protein CHUAL_002366 [Chamberlinius hualienensis]
MKASWILLCLYLTIVFADGRRRRKYSEESEDFEFADEVQSDWEFKGQQDQVKEKTTEQSDGGGGVSEITTEPTRQPLDNQPASSFDYCSMVRCPYGSKCVLKDHAAICMQEKSVLSSDSEEDTSEDEEEEEEMVEEQEAFEAESYKGMIGCTQCPVSKPNFICGSDNNTYSSMCRLNYHNCVHSLKVIVQCSGFCPCQGEKSKHEQKVAMANHRWNQFVSKYKSTAEKLGHRNSLNGDGQNEASSSSIIKDKSFQKPWQKDKKLLHVEVPDDKQKQQGHNSVLKEKIPSPGLKEKQCSQKDLDVMGNRLLDWFSVVMADAKRNKSRRRSYGLSPATFPGYCSQEVKWMFFHMDQNSDAYLSLKELYDLEHESHEHCLRPFLEHCDINRDMLVSSQEWCKCFDKSEKPCTSSRNRARLNSGVGTYIPDCDEVGYFKQNQCHASTGQCWCVDKHGVEYPNSRMKGKPDCDKFGNQSEREANFENGDEEGDNEGGDDEDDGDDLNVEGSAYRPMDL